MIHPMTVEKKLTVVSALIVLVVVTATPRYLDLVSVFGHYIPQGDLPTDYLKGVVWSFALGLSILLWPVSRANKRSLLAAWGAKIAVTLGVMLLYESLYGLDAYMYFDQSNKGAFSLAEFSLVAADAGTKNIINIASLNNVLVPNSYHALKVSFAMIGLVGVYLFYRSAVTFLGREERRIFYLIAFFPGIFFWSSILGKEPVVFFAISLYVYGIINWHVQRRYRNFLPMAAGIALGMLIRIWLGPIMVIPAGLLFFKSCRNLPAKAALVVISLALLSLTAGPMLERFKIQAFEDVLSAADKTTQGFVTTEGGSTQQLNVDLTSPAGALKFLPVAAFTALFRPLPGEVMNPFGLLAGIESAILLTLLIKACRRTRLKELADPLTLWAVSFVAIWALVNGIVSSTNFGVGVRYKLQVLPVLLGVLLHLSRKREQAAAA